jgi:hypothetical protein
VYWEWPHWDNASHWQHMDRRWRGTVQHHVGYKWLWLNAHAPDAPGPAPADAPRVTIAVVENVEFADERFARAHAQRQAAAGGEGSDE